jgi:hypothetical protein
VPPHPLVLGGGHTRLRLKGWGSPNSNEGTHCFRSVESLLWGAEPRFELGPALQQAYALLSELRCTHVVKLAHRDPENKTESGHFNPLYPRGPLFRMSLISNVKLSILEERILSIFFVPSIVEEQILWFVFVPSIV